MRMSRDPQGIFYIEHVERFQASPEKGRACVSPTLAKADGQATTIRIPQDPGQAGKGAGPISHPSARRVQHQDETSDR